MAGLSLKHIYKVYPPGKEKKIKKAGENLFVTFANNETQSYNISSMRKIDEAYLDGE